MEEQTIVRSQAGIEPATSRLSFSPLGTAPRRQYLCGASEASTKMKAIEPSQVVSLNRATCNHCLSYSPSLPHSHWDCLMSDILPLLWYSHVIASLFAVTHRFLALESMPIVFTVVDYPG